ncbi:toxin-antitoxin system TumE family protein [Candidatus Pyrohabitans sp.]
MLVLEIYLKLKRRAERDYSDIVKSTKLLGGKTSLPNKLRIYFIDGSFLDVWLSHEDDYSYHWESTLQTGLIHRWDNAPDHPDIATFPKHFHEGTKENVKESYLSEDPEEALLEILNFIRMRLKK